MGKGGQKGKGAPYAGNKGAGKQKGKGEGKQHWHNAGHHNGKGGKGQRRPRAGDASGWITEISRATQLDDKVSMLFENRATLAAACPSLSLADLTTLTESLWQCRNAFMTHRLEEALQMLAPAYIPSVMQKLLPTVCNGERLQVILNVLHKAIEAEPTMGNVLQNPNNKRNVEAALLRCPSTEARQLWERLEVAAESGATAPLRNLVDRRAREQAAAAAAAQPQLPDPEEIGILPHISDLLKVPTSLPSNRNFGWSAEDVDLYRQTHFMLYREELLAPLRESVAGFFTSVGGAQPQSLTTYIAQTFGFLKSAPMVTNFYHYPDTHAVGFAVSKSKQPMVQLKFNLPPKRRIDFTSGAHLIYGSLVVLFEVDRQNNPKPDTAVYAVVEEFDLREVQFHHKVGVCLLDAEDWSRFSVTQSYIMVESPGYFHAVRPVLEWLQKPASLRGLALRNDLLSGQRAGRVEFLQNVRVDLSCLYKREIMPRRELWKDRDPLAPWPDAADVELDPAQQEAMKHILSSTVPLVQGPPGTGKSYIGVKAVQILRQALDQKGYKEPIVLICLTNHALDQFLEDLLDLFPGRLIRFGGRTKSEEERLLECLVHNHMRSTPDEYRERESYEKQLESEVKKLETLRQLVATEIGKVKLLLASIPLRHLSEIMEDLGDEYLECGLYLPGDWPNPKKFFVDVLWTWMDGEPIARARALTQIPKPSRQRQHPVVAANPFAVLDDEAEYEAWQTVLSHVDKQIGPSPLAQHWVANLSHNDWVSEAGSQGSGSDVSDFDEDEVEAILDDRFDGMAHDRQQSRSRRVEQDRPQDSSLTAAMAERVKAYNKAANFEKQIQMCRSRLQQAQEDIEERAEEGEWSEDQKWQALDKAVRASKKEMHRLQSDAAFHHAQWKKAKADARAALLRSLRNDQQVRLQEVIGEDLAVRELSSHVPDDVGWRTPQRERLAVARNVSEAATAAATETFKTGFAKSQRSGTILGQLKKGGQLRACKRAAVVGMTSTFAALNADLLHQMGPRVVVVEEAGELLECQLMACLSSPNLQQVVLIGDHQQLRPKLNTFALSKHHKFDLSLFERLVVSGCQRAKLVTQLRMQPDVCALVRPFYEAIHDHPRVLKYPAVPGVADSLCWISHDKWEDNFGQQHATSKYHTHEAQFACRLAQHFVYNGVERGRITLITPYLGQKREMRKWLPRELCSSWVGADGQAAAAAEDGKGKQKGGKGKGKDKGGKAKGKGKNNNGQRMIPGVRVVTIDDYQGEENDVVILSLVRSNPPGKLGFVAIENRIIVALSRARHGMYILGNAEMFKKDDRWFRVMSQLEDKNRITDALNLRCKKHPADEAMVRCAEDFSLKAAYGGCNRKCDSMLPKCGHRCPLKCHPFDAEHLDVVCTAVCSRPRPAGCDHKCGRLCKNCPGSVPEDPCPTPCKELVDALLPCGHTQEEPCYKVQRPEQKAEVNCNTVVPVVLACGHTRHAKCFESKNPDALKCTFEKDVKASCGHFVKQRCHTQSLCKRICSQTIRGCGHPCRRKCSEPHDHEQCEEPCSNFLLCGHKCQELCGQTCTILCGDPCSRLCTHGFKCPKKCFEPCVKCHEPCDWKCPHYQCSKLCHEVCDRPRCDEKCTKQLECGHPCKGMCGEPCPKCVQCEVDKDEKCPLSMELLTKINRLYQLDCGHMFDVDLLDMYMDKFDAEPDGGGHRAIRAIACPICKQQVHTSPRYNQQVKKQLALIDAVKKELEKKHGRNHKLTDEERRQIDRAMGEGTGRGTGAGHWFACPNGHAYFIGDCGGAMQESRCPECGATVGGGSHTLRGDNQFIEDFTNAGEAARPAWPTMGGGLFGLI